MLITLIFLFIIIFCIINLQFVSKIISNVFKASANLVGSSDREDKRENSNFSYKSTLGLSKQNNGKSSQNTASTSSQEKRSENDNILQKIIRTIANLSYGKILRSN